MEFRPQQEIKEKQAPSFSPLCHPSTPQCDIDIEIGTDSLGSESD